MSPRREPNQMPRVLAALLGALALLLSLQLLHPFLPWVSEHTRNTRFFAGPEADKPEDWELRGEDPPDAEKSSPLPHAKMHSTLRSVRGLFQDLDKRRLRRLRIAWYSDSLTEGDVLTGPLRRLLQERFGGEGTGFHGFSPRHAAHSFTLIHEHSAHWERFNYFSLKEEPDLRLPLSGELYHAQPGAWVRYQALKRSRRLGASARLFYGPPREGARPPEKLTAKSEDGSAEILLSGAADLNTAPLPAGKRLKLEFDVSPLRPLYGVSFDPGTGVTLDNYSTRGNGGDLLFKLDPGLLKDFQKELGSRILVMHFGLNALREGEKDFRWYRGLLRKAIQHLKANLPGMKLVMLSVLDSGVMGKDGQVRTDRSLPYVLAAQRAAAMDEGIVFIDLYRLLGGPGTMRRWVEEEKLANKDYKHLNHRGGEAVARVLFEQLSGEKP